MFLLLLNSFVTHFLIDFLIVVYLFFVFKWVSTMACYCVLDDNGSPWVCTSTAVPAAHPRTAARQIQHILY